MGTSGKNKSYSELGKLLDAMARERDVRGPYNIAHHLDEAVGYQVSGQGMSKYMYGEHLPRPKFIEAFAEAFELTLRERVELAWAYAYGSRLDFAHGRTQVRESLVIPQDL
jgi:hypothetical protein